QDGPAIGAESQGKDHLVVRHNGPEGGSGSHSPESRGTILGAGKDGFAVRANGNAVDSGLMPKRRAERLAGHVPQPSGAVQAPRQKHLAVPAELQGTDWTFVLESRPGSACLQVPEPGGVVPASGKQFFAVRGKGHAHCPNQVLERFVNLFAVTVPKTCQSFPGHISPGPAQCDASL